jgi:hypothetical protein
MSRIQIKTHQKTMFILILNNFVINVIGFTRTRALCARYRNDVKLAAMRCTKKKEYHRFKQQNI